MKQEENNCTTPREAYEAPTCEIIEMQNEGNILIGSNTDHDGFGDGDGVNWGY